MTYVITYFADESLNGVSNKSNFSLYNRHRLYLKGAEKFNQETDFVYYARSLRLLKMLVSSLMDDSEKYLSVYQHQNCLRLID